MLSQIRPLFGYLIPLVLYIRYSGCAKRSIRFFPPNQQQEQIRMEYQSSSCDGLYQRLHEISRELPSAQHSDRKNLNSEREEILRRLEDILKANPRPTPSEHSPFDWDEEFCVRVENLHPDLDNDGLKKVFSSFGGIKKGKVPGYGSHHGYLTFADAGQAKHFIATMNGHQFPGWTSPIVVRRVFKEEGEESDRNVETEELGNGGDKALCRRIADITEELKSCNDPTTREKLSEERKELLSRLAKIPSIRPPKLKKEHYPNCTLLRVENLHPGLDNDGLRKIFLPFGKLSMARVVEDKCYGLVLFTDVQQAKNAIAAINGLEFDGWLGPIAVREVLTPPAPLPHAVLSHPLAVNMLQVLVRGFLQSVQLWKSSIGLQWHMILESF